MNSLYVVFSDTTGARILMPRPERVSGLRFSTAVDAGYKDLSCHYAGNLTDAFLWYLERLNYRVQVYEGDTVRWEGRISGVEVTDSGVNISARGYYRAAYDQSYSGTFSAAEHANSIITTVITASCPNLSAGTIGDPGTVIANITYGDNQYPGDIFTKLAEVGSATARWHWAVWEDKQVDFAAKNTTVNWRCGLRDVVPGGLSLRRDLEEIWNSIYATYAAAGVRSTTAVAANTASQTKYGLTRSRTINAGQVTATVAQALRDVFLAEHADIPQQSTLRLNDMVYGADTGRIGVRIPLWRIRAGDVLQIHDLVPASTMIDSPGLDALRTFSIIGTEYDVDANVMTLSPDRPAQTTDRILSALALSTGDNVQRLAAYFTRTS